MVSSPALGTFAWGEIAAEETQPTRELETALGELIKRYELPSIVVGLSVDGKRQVVAVGRADKGRAATAKTIYAIASCSKPIVGLATAILMSEVPTFDLDTDINVYLKWPKQLVHPSHSEVPVTMRQLLLHKSGIASDGPATYQTYPKPNPDQSLDVFLQAMLLEREESWLDSAPGAAFGYSNLGTALAALVIEKVSKQPFDAYCNAKLFTPLGMTDTRWHHRDFTKAQHARMARPFDVDGKPLEHYSFNDYPSGSIRTTAHDYLTLLEVLINEGMHDNKRVLSKATVKRFLATPMLIIRDEGGYTHDGGEAGVMSSVGFSEDVAYVYFVNGELSEGDMETFQASLDEIIEATFD